MDLNFNKVFEFVRSIIISDILLKIPPEEITMESHLYFDLLLDSRDFLGLLQSIESDLNLSFPQHYLDMDANEEEGSTEAGKLMWEVYRLSATASLKEHLEQLGFSTDAVQRFQQIEEFCRGYNVTPFTVGNVCACIIHVLQTRVNKSY